MHGRPRWRPAIATLRLRAACACPPAAAPPLSLPRFAIRVDSGGPVGSWELGSMGKAAEVVLLLASVHHDSSHHDARTRTGEELRVFAAESRYGRRHILSYRVLRPCLPRCE